jgi:hypothetical protein
MSRLVAALRAVSRSVAWRGGGAEAPDPQVFCLEENGLGGAEEVVRSILRTMTTADAKNPSHDIPTALFEQFIAELENTDVPGEVVAALRKALLEDKTFTDAALRAAVTVEEKAV